MFKTGIGQFDINSAEVKYWLDQFGPVGYRFGYLQSPTSYTIIAQRGEFPLPLGYTEIF